MRDMPFLHDASFTRCAGKTGRLLLSEQGFESVLALGEADTAPALLQRQSVVAGVSNGDVFVKRRATQPAKLRATMQPL